jgi:uncharacterized membrane protein
MKKLLPILLILAAFLVGIYLSPQLPYLMASHWGITGQVNGYSSKNFAIYFLPSLMVGLYFLFLFLPSVDPYKKNFSQFKNYYQNFIIIVFIFLLYLHLATLFWNLGYQFNIIQILSPGFALLFYYAGVLTQNAHQNWFVGIRTPWTMSNKIVWQKTHSLGGKLFKLTGLLSFLGIFLPNFAIYLIIIPITFITVVVFVYSYLEYQKTLTP